ncbi:MAG: glycogen debranching protein GlgX [Planctomycetaceae bacterium]
MTAALQPVHSFPFGATPCERGFQFAVFSRSATAMRLLLYDDVRDREPSRRVEFDPAHRCGDVWFVMVEGVGHGQLYHLQAEGPFDPERGMRFDSAARLIDPYAEALAGEFLPSDDGVIRPPKCVIVDESFDWRGDRQLNRPLDETVIYEMHVRGFTQSPTSGAKRPGTYLGVIERIPYLQSLGVTAVELMPVAEFPTNDWDGSPLERPNYWGYDPLAFFAPHRGYADGPRPGDQVREFKQMVQALHAAGIEVILDVVFNHTPEGNELGPTLSFKGLENPVYYLLEEEKSRYRNYSGCGNTLNGNHPVVREMIFHCLRHWVVNYHVDGFRFDLASILSRDRSGRLMPNPPTVEVIAEDPLLGNTKLIAEAWDAAGAYQVGSFANVRWAEWNGRYRDDVRRFWNGFTPRVADFATRLAGSSDLYQSSNREPFHGINFVTAHDGFTLNDLVAFTRKHNHANGEDNLDGERHNLSVNFGVEGPSDDPRVETGRRKQVRNFLATLFLSQGVPMLLFGDECRRTQRGNNNTYCQDNELSWFDWTLVERNADLVRFVRELIRLRLEESTLRQREFLTGDAEPDALRPDASWFGPDGGPVRWKTADYSLTLLLAGAPADEGRPAARSILVLAHAGEVPYTFRLPDVTQPREWRLVVDTAAVPPADVFPDDTGPRLSRRAIKMQPRSLRCYRSVMQNRSELN